jgi:hypothetical protein
VHEPEIREQPFRLEFWHGFRWVWPKQYFPVCPASLTVDFLCTHGNANKRECSSPHLVSNFREIWEKTEISENIDWNRWQCNGWLVSVPGSTVPGCFWQFIRFISLDSLVQIFRTRFFPHTFSRPVEGVGVWVEGGCASWWLFCANKLSDGSFQMIRTKLTLSARNAISIHSTPAQQMTDTHTAQSLYARTSAEIECSFEHKWRFDGEFEVDQIWWRSLFQDFERKKWCGTGARWGGEISWKVANWWE